MESKEKRFGCCKCDKSFQQQCQLIVHLRQHTGEKPFVCTYCAKGFASSKVLKVHERVHTGERPYKCTYCEKRFSAFPNVIVHQRIHTNEKPYICKFCCRGFEHSGNLNRHFKAHIVDSGYRCILCGKSFQLEEDLLEHTKTDHHTEYKMYMSSDKSKLEEHHPHLASNGAVLSGGNSRDSADVKSVGGITATTKKHLLRKIKEKEWMVISPKSPEANGPIKLKVHRRERDSQVTHLSDRSPSPLTDTLSLSEESEKRSNPDVIDLETDSQYESNCQMEYVPRKLLKLEIREDISITENRDYRTYKDSFSSSSSSNVEGLSNNDSCDTSSSDYFHSLNGVSPSSPPPILAQNNEPPFWCYDPYDVEVPQQMDHSNSNNCHSPSRRDINNLLYEENSYKSTPPPLIPIENMDQSGDISHEAPSLEHFGNHSLKNRFDSSDLRNSLDECDFYSEQIKSELFNDKHMLHSRPKEEHDLFDYKTNGVSGKTGKLPVLSDKQKEALIKKMERSLHTLVGKDVMKHFGFPVRTCEQVLICILDMTKKRPCADVRVNETDRMKINMRKLIECSFPSKNSWETLGWEGKPIELILDQIEAQENVGVGFSSATSCLPSRNYFTKVQKKGKYIFNWQNRTTTI